MIPGLNQRPVIVALAGPNGAGKSTFYGAHLITTGLRLVNADVLARELGVDAYRAAEMAGALREKLLEQRESFIFETVFSDPVGDKISFLQRAAGAGYNVILCFIGISDPAMSEERVTMRVTQGGHDVPVEKLAARFPRPDVRDLVRRLPAQTSRTLDVERASEKVPTEGSPREPSREPSVELATPSSEHHRSPRGSHWT